MTLGSHILPDAQVLIDELEAGTASPEMQRAAADEIRKQTKRADDNAGHTNRMRAEIDGMTRIVGIYANGGA